MSATGTEKRVCEDIAKRQEIGIAKYKTTVEDNHLPLREWLQHAYEEALDKAIYLKRAIEEMESTDHKPLRGKMVRAGTFAVEDDEINGCVIECDIEVMRNASELPLYRECVIVSAEYYEQLTGKQP